MGERREGCLGGNVNTLARWEPRRPPILNSDEAWSSTIKLRRSRTKKGDGEATRCLSDGLQPAPGFARRKSVEISSAHLKLDKFL